MPRGGAKPNAKRAAARSKPGMLPTKRRHPGTGNVIFTDAKGNEYIRQRQADNKLAFVRVRPTLKPRAARKK